MLVYITGVPGSGKSYKAVKHIYDNFVKEKTDKYIYCYTNINQFDFSVSDDIRPLDFDDLKQKLTILYQMYKNKATDEELNEKAKELEIYKCLFVIDEAQNYFQTKDEILVWWLTYHRHLYHDIFLITQNLALIDRKYKPLAEFFYKAVPASLRLNKKVFKYRTYVDSRMTKASEAGVEKLKFDENIIKLYHSGDVVKAPNFILRFLTFSFIILLLLLIAFYFYKSSLESNSNENNHQSSATTQQIPKNTHIQEPKPIKIKKDNYLDDYKYYYQIVCFKNKCIVNNNFSISKYFILQLPEISNSKIYYQGNYLSNQMIYLATNINLNKFKPGGQYEETNNSTFNRPLF